MELTVGQALQKGDDAYRAGRSEEAGVLYASILDVDPNHHAANHSMGVVAFGTGKMHEALPYFKIASEINPSIAEYWISYITTLINLGKLIDAGSVLVQAKKQDLNSKVLDQLGKQLAAQGLRPIETISDGLEESNSSKPNILNTTKLDNALRLAARKFKDGQFKESRSIYEDILKKFPKNKKALTNIKLIEQTDVDAIYNRGNHLFQDGDLVAAIAHYEQALEIDSGYANASYNMAIACERMGNQEQSIESYKQTLKIKPHFAEAHNNLGNVLQIKKDLDGAENHYKQALKIRPHFAEAHNNLGNVLREKNDFEAATKSFKMAIEYKADFADAYNNLGITLSNVGHPEAAIDSYREALRIKPDFAKAYLNMGNSLSQKGFLKAAINSFKEAIKINPNYSVAYNNMSSALISGAEIKAALVSCKKALKINPNDSDAAWNLSGLAKNISESVNSLERCLQADQTHLKAKLTLSALRYYQGDKSSFNQLMQSDFKDHPLVRSFAWAFSLQELPELHFHRWALFDSVIGQSELTRPFYEFGVWRGKSVQYLLKAFKKGYGFDTFKGLPEDWHNQKAGSYSSDGVIPQIKGGEFIVGEFNETLPVFFSVAQPMASVINFDADLYSSTLSALNYSKPVIDQFTILIFDEFITNDNWEQDEFKALNEFCFQNDYTYKVIAISFFTKQVAVKLVGI